MAGGSISFKSNNSKKVRRKIQEQARCISLRKIIEDMKEHKRPTFAIKSKHGIHFSRSDTNTDMMHIRAQQVARNKRVKPSMPKMPWD